MTFGHQEPHGVRAAVAFAKARFPGQPVICLGESLGGAACLLADPPLDLDALIVESVFPNISAAVANRIASRLGGLGSALLSPLLVHHCAWRLGITVDDLAPELAIGGLRLPVFVIGGALDERTPPAETRRLFDAAAEPKELWIVPDAGHQNLHTLAGEIYERRILAFLRRNIPRR